MSNQGRGCQAISRLGFAETTTVRVVTKRVHRSRHLHDGVLIDGVRVNTVFHREGIIGFILINIVFLAFSFYGYRNPKVDIVIRKDGEKGILYSEGPYRAMKVGSRISEIADRIREVGVDQFLSEVGESPVAGSASEGG